MLRDKLFGGKKDQGCCCGTRIVGVRQIKVRDNWVGIAGIDETFEEFYKQGKAPEDSTGDELVGVLSKDNFIPDESKSVYKTAFLREYQRFYEARKK